MTASIDISSFIARQLRDWPEVSRRFDGLRTMRSRHVQLGGVTLTIQYNPLRIGSSIATAATVAERPCFLCAANRPPEQICLPWNDYHILVNPYPALPEHLTIADSGHKPQLFAGRTADMLALARCMADCLLFFNGPQCGASAPDHCHFQAVRAGYTPIERFMDNAPEGHSLQQGFSGLWHLIVGSDAGFLENEMAQCIDSYGNMMNVFCRYLHRHWVVLVVPRRKHRPQCYFEQGERQLLVSPGALEMAGIVIAAREADFERITASDMEQIYGEVGLFNATT